MNVTIEPGIYVVAVSGGVDSVVLLDMLRQKPDLKLIVAHFDHGIRPDASLDRKHVQSIAAQHNLPFVFSEGHLDRDVSEEEARRARYEFLHRVRQVSGAQAIITAHHQDDLLETAVHNALRGTGRRGLVSLRSREHVKRPLLHVPKEKLYAYARDQGLTWREDSSNTDTKYTRNYIRHEILPRLSPAKQKVLLRHLQKLREIDIELEQELINHLHLHPATDELDRHWFIMLPHAVAKEVLHNWLTKNKVNNVNQPMIERLVVASKTYAPNKQAIIDKTTRLEIGKNRLALRFNGR